MNPNVFLGVIIPFIGTTLGASCVWLIRNELNPKLQKALLGFAAGVMTAASVWSLLIPAMEQSAPMGQAAWVPAAVGFVAGIVFLLLMDRLIPHLHLSSKTPEGPKTKMNSSAMMALAVTLHNIPEGMAVGVVFAGMLSGMQQITTAGAFALSIGIAIQNFPEGAIVSLPLRTSAASRKKSFRHCRTDCRAADDFGGQYHHADSAVFAGLCRRGDVVRGGRRIGSGSLRRRAHQHRHHRICRRICIDDDPGRRFGLTF